MAFHLNHREGFCKKVTYILFISITNHLLMMILPKTSLYKATVFDLGIIIHIL